MKETELSAGRAPLLLYPFVFVVSSAIVSAMAWVAIYVLNYEYIQSQELPGLWIPLAIGIFINAVAVIIIEVRLHRKVAETKILVSEALAALKSGSVTDGVRKGVLTGIQNSKLLGLSSEKKSMVVSYSELPQDSSYSSRDERIESVAVTPVIVIAWPFLIIYGIFS